jgi:hypothetical protein
MRGRGLGDDRLAGLSLVSLVRRHLIRSIAGGQNLCAPKKASAIYGALVRALWSTRASPADRAAHGELAPRARLHVGPVRRPHRMKRPSATVMKDRKKSESVGHSGPWTSPIPCQTRSAATIQSHPTTAIARIPVTSLMSEECLVLSIRRGEDEGTQPHGVRDG